MKIVSAEILIKAPPKTVWQVLSDFNNYPEWNPTISYISGELEPNSFLETKIHLPKQRPFILRPRIIKLEEEKNIIWAGSKINHFFFLGVHSFNLIPQEENQTLFKQIESFSGLLRPFAGKHIKKAQESFEVMNLALKYKAESLLQSSILESNPQ